MNERPPYDPALDAKLSYDAAIAAKKARGDTQGWRIGGAENLLGGRVMLHCGDCRDAIKAMPDNSIDSVVTDPPYALVSVTKRYGNPDAKPCGAGTDGSFRRLSKGFMGKQWDTGETAFAVDFWAEVFRVLKPGGHVVSFSGTRTYHRLVCAIEDAGFEIRDQLAWVYGSGFPKSHDVSKGIDKAAGHWRGKAGAIKPESIGQVAKGIEYERTDKGDSITDTARQWQGWGTALKPAWEPICLARKPLIGTVAANVLAHGTGALNIDATRVPTSQGAARNNLADSTVCTCSWRVASQPSRIGNIHSQASASFGRAQHADLLANGDEYARQEQPVPNSQFDCLNDPRSGDEHVHSPEGDGPKHLPSSRDEGKSRDRCARCGRIRVDLSKPYGTISNVEQQGRWPANIVHDGSDEVLAGFPHSESTQRTGKRTGKANGVFGAFTGQDNAVMGHGDSGSAARFFYTAKADQRTRLGARHPTVKPLDLMQWLVRLVTPKGGVVLDPFAGTGTTGEAAWREGFSAVLMERETDSQADIRMRMQLASEYARREAVAKSKRQLRGAEGTPLFPWKEGRLI
jgi:site-specific DNA-methyltransferase (adenine-specific)